MNYARNEDMCGTLRTTNTPAYSSILSYAFSDEGAEFITLAEAKAYLRIDASETTFDDQVTAAIAAARNEVEHYLNMSLIKRTITVVMNIANGMASLSFTPVISLTSVFDTENHAIDSTTYSLKAGMLNITGYNSAVLTYDAGYEDVATVPVVFKQGILRLISFDWQHRGDDSTQRSIAVITGLKSYRRVV